MAPSASKISGKAESAPRHILEMSVREQIDFLNSFDVILSDCDGVVWLVCKAIPQTGETINLLKKAGKSVKFVSNYSVRSDVAYVEKFHSIGAADVKLSDIMHPGKAMLHYIKKHYPGERAFSLCSDTSNDLFRKNGIDIETLDPVCNYSPEVFMDAVRAKEKVRMVLIDLNFNLQYAQLVKAQQYLLEDDCVLIAGSTDSHSPIAPGFIIAGFADFTNHLAFYGQKQPIIVGKPSPVLGEIVKETFEIKNAKRCLFIGDTLTYDIGFGKECGFQTLFVLSGANTKDDMLKASHKLKPDFYANGLSDFIDLLKNCNNFI